MKIPQRLKQFRHALRTPTYVLREFVHRLPDPRFNWHSTTVTEHERAVEHIETLRREGIVLLPGYVGGELVQRLHDAFETVLGDVADDQSNPDAFVNTRFVQADPIFMQPALDDLLLEIIAGYYRKPFTIGRASALRLLPTPSQRYGSFQWHHDTRGRQVHLMVLLTAVSANGQRMRYLRRSHRHYYGHYRGNTGLGSRFEADMVARRIAPELISEVVGPRGTVAIFDSNGLHSGTRNETEPRDALIYC
ncbi:MAG: hypothetical protein ACREX3_10935, partial [Gammaproteobacteria bacterium]